MKATIQSLGVLAAALLLIATAQAATYYMTVSDVTVQSAGPYTKDQYSVVLKVTYEAPSGVTTTNCRARVSSLPSGWAVLDDYNTNYKTLSTCTGSTTFEVMPTTTGSYDGSSIIVEVSGSDASGQNTVSVGTGSPSGTLVVESQPVLSLTILNDVSNITVNDTSETFPVEYEITNTGGESTASTSNLQLTITANPLGSVVFDNDLSSKIVGSGSIASGQKITGTEYLHVSDTTVTNTPSFTLTATADNTLHNSQTSGMGVQCESCISIQQASIIMFGGWNLVSLDVSL